MYFANPNPATELKQCFTADSSCLPANISIYKYTQCLPQSLLWEADFSLALPGDADPWPCSLKSPLCEQEARKIGECSLSWRYRRFPGNLWCRRGVCARRGGVQVCPESTQVQVPAWVTQEGAVDSPEVLQGSPRYGNTWEWAGEGTPGAQEPLERQTRHSQGGFATG